MSKGYKVNGAYTSVATYSIELNNLGLHYDLKLCALRDMRI